jgi:DNA polymerase III alpha subunit (gram-positive type)
MNYVFFDVECANCLNGEGKICSFGYVKTDENFKVIKKKDILVDPAAPFLLGNAKTGNGIKLAYPLFRFQRARTFPHYYKEIKALLEDKDTLCFGFAVCQDVSYISYSCKRYGLPIIEFKFYDIQKMEKELNHRQNISGLDHLVEEYHLTSYTYHRSDDDALMTMEVFKVLLDKNHFTLQYALTAFPDALDDTDNFLEQQAKRQKQKALKKAHNEKVNQLYAAPHVRFDINLYNPNLYKKVFFFDYAVLSKEIDFLLKHKEAMEAHGMVLTRNPALAHVAIIDNNKKRLNIATLPKKIIYMSVNDFKEELNKKRN